MVNTFENIKCKGVKLADDQKSIIKFSQMITKFENKNKSKLIRFQCPLLGISLHIDMHRKSLYILLYKNTQYAHNRYNYQHREVKILVDM